MSADETNPALTEAEARSIEAFQARKAIFQPRWNMTIALLFLPGVALFVIGAGLMETLKSGGQGRLLGWLLYSGTALFFAGMGRGIYLMARYLRCPNCERVQKPGWQYPYRKCRQCGARLSHGMKDSR